MAVLESEVEPLVRLSLQNFSYSRIKSFQECNLRYFYSYILKLPQTFGMAATLGNIIHKALEVTLSEGYGADHKELLSNYNAAVVEIDPERKIPPSMIDDGANMLVEYADTNRTAPRDEPMILEEDFFTEMPFSLVIGQGRFNGYIDFLLVEPNLTTIVDFKSGKWEVANKNVPTDLQLAVYSLVARYLWPDKPVYSELYYLRSGHRKGHLFSDDDLSVAEDKLAKAVEEILTTEDFKPTQNAGACTWCSYAKDGTCPTGAARLKKRGLIQIEDQ